MSHLKSREDAARFRAAAGEVQGLGETPRDALEALMERVPSDISTPIVIWPYNREDEFFTQAQQDRLQELKSRRDTLTATEQQELEQLVEAAFDATIARTQNLQRVKS
ncbi:MAG: hypothetical protein V4671_29830 [Armatimonadota bacterium]